MADRSFEAIFTHRRKLLILSALSSASAFWSMPALGQAGTASASAAASPNDGAAEIVVTAQRRKERVQDVPIAISVIGGQQLERQQILDIRDLGRTAASLNFGPTSGPGAGAYIRGLGSFGFSKAADAAVGIVVDGVVQGNTNISNLFDIGRVEVLRGPQGTLFGQSVSAGVINISTIEPDPDKLEGKASVELSPDDFAGATFGRQIGRVALNVPVSKTSAIRISAYGANTTGVSRDVYLGKDSSLKEFGGRARFRGEFGNVVVNLIGDYSKTNNDYGSYFPSFYKVDPNSQLAAMLAACGAKVGPRSFENCANDKDQFANSITWGTSAQFDISLGDFTLTSITAFRKQPSTQHIDVDRLAHTTLDIYETNATNFNQFTQEIRLASPLTGMFSYTVGAFYLHANTTNSQLDIVTLRFPDDPDPFVDGIDDRQKAKAENLSAFGEGRINLNPVVVFAGARVNRSDIRQDATHQDPYPGGDLIANSGQYKKTDLSWRVGGEYHFGSNSMLYATASRGYKSAQLDNVSTITEPARVILPEKPLAFEAGIKGSVLNGALAVNLDLFHDTVKDYQTTRCVVVNPTTLQCVPTNISKVISKGIEADVFGRVMRGLTVNASATYDIAKYPSGFTDNTGISLGGQQLAYAPRFKMTFSGEYATPLTDVLEGFVSSEAEYQVKTRLSFSRATSDYIYPARLIIGGRIGVRADDRWSVAVFVRNLTNEPLPVEIGISPAPLGDDTNTAGTWQYVTQQSKRLVGLQADYSF